MNVTSATLARDITCEDEEDPRLPRGMMSRTLFALRPCLLRKPAYPEIPSYSTCSNCSPSPQTPIQAGSVARLVTARSATSATSVMTKLNLSSACVVALCRQRVHL